MGMVSSSSGLFTLGRNRQEFINAPLRKPDKHKQIMLRSRLFQTSSMKKEEADTCASISQITAPDHSVNNNYFITKLRIDKAKQREDHNRMAYSMLLEDQMAIARDRQNNASSVNSIGSSESPTKNRYASFTKQKSCIITSPTGTGLPSPMINIKQKGSVRILDIARSKKPSRSNTLKHYLGMMPSAQTVKHLEASCDSELLQQTTFAAHAKR